MRLALLLAAITWTVIIVAFLAAVATIGPVLGPATLAAVAFIVWRHAFR